jgi:outer membrane lipoprotein carrier protein
MRIKLLLVLLLCPLPTFAAAAKVELGAVIQTLETPFQATEATPGGVIEDFQAAFFQESQIVSLDRVQRGEGDVSFKFVPPSRDRVAQAMFRWEYRQPSVQEIVSDGRTLWVYLPENSQVIESDLSNVSRQGDNPVTFLSGLGNLSRDFTIRWAVPSTDRDGNYILDLQPQRSSQLIQTLQIVVDRGAVSDYLQSHQTGRLFPILATRVTDQNGNRTSIEFRDIRVNCNLPELLFTFKAPAGVEVMRPSSDQPGF